MKAIKQTVRHYYKYAYTPWTQPILSSNGIMGGNSFACSASSYYDDPRQPFNAFDGLNDSAEAHCWHANYGYPQWLSWYNPVELKITNLKVYNRPVSANAIIDYQIQISPDNSNWTTIKTGTNTVITVESSWNIDLSDIENNVSKYWRIYITSGSDANYVVIGEMEITATKQTIVECTQEEAEWYEDIDVYKVPTTTVRHYYKYAYTPWTQPVATSNTTVLPEGNMIFTTNEEYYISHAYGAMDGVKSGTDQSKMWLVSYYTERWWQVKFPYQLTITGLKHYNTQGYSSGDCTIQGRYYTSSDMTTPIGDAISTPDTAWYETTIQNIPSEGITTDTIYFTKTNGGTCSGIGELEITATKQTIVECTQEEAEWYEDIVTFYGVNQ